MSASAAETSCGFVGVVAGVSTRTARWRSRSGSTSGGWGRLAGARGLARPAVVGSGSLMFGVGSAGGGRGWLAGARGPGRPAVVGAMASVDQQEMPCEQSSRKEGT